MYTQKICSDFLVEKFPPRNLFHSIYGGIFRRRWNPEKKLLQKSKQEKRLCWKYKIGILGSARGKTKFSSENPAQ